MSRPDPIEYAERLYSAISDANFSPLSFLAFGKAVKDRVAMRSMPRIAVEPFMRVVGEMLDLEEAVSNEAVVDGGVIDPAAELAQVGSETDAASDSIPAAETTGASKDVQPAPCRLRAPLPRSPGKTAPPGVIRACLGSLPPKPGTPGIPETGDPEGSDSGRNHVVVPVSGFFGDPGQSGDRTGDGATVV